MLQTKLKIFRISAPYSALLKPPSWCRSVSASPRWARFIWASSPGVKRLSHLLWIFLHQFEEFAKKTQKTANNFLQLFEVTQVFPTNKQEIKAIS